jgi:hypothetical protein
MSGRATPSLVLCSFLTLGTTATPQYAQAQVGYYSPVTSCGCAQPTQYQASYSPTNNQPVSYQAQTVMRQVPVTTYQSMYVIDTATGATYGYWQPVSTTMQWQAQSDVSQTANRPIYPGGGDNNNVAGTTNPKVASIFGDNAAEIRSLRTDVNQLRAEVRHLVEMLPAPNQ